MKYAFIATERALYPLNVLCRVLSVSKSGFHDYLYRQLRPDRDAALREALHRTYQASRQTYGRPRLVKALRGTAHQAGPKRIARLMREEGIEGKVKGRFQVVRESEQMPAPAAANLLDRRFAINDPSPAWVGDITNIKTRQGWLYLAVVIDLKTRKVLGYSVDKRRPADLALRALMNAANVSPPQSGTLFHSDQGVQYSCHAFRQALADLGMTQSMSRKGNCWDNAVAESFFATLKSEEAFGVYPTTRAAEVGIASYIHAFYNPVRLHSALGYTSPTQYETQLKSVA